MQEPKSREQLLEFFLAFISDHKKDLFKEIIQYRTRYLTVVLEDIYQSHNASAVMRSCDCFGVQDVHVIENKNQYSINKDVTMGSTKWLNINRYNEKEFNTLDCFDALRSEGYRIVATTPHENNVMLEDLPLENGKIALVFGTELEGLTQPALENADEFVKLPMYGFTESFNISVTAALFLYHLTEKLRKSNINWQVSEKEKTEILISWSKSVVKKADALERQFFKDL